MHGQPRHPSRRAPRRWRMGKGCGSVRRRRAAPAEARSRNRPLLYSMRGYQYCDLLLSQGTGRRGARPGGSDLAMARRSNSGLLRHRARYSDPRPRPSRPCALVECLGKRAFRSQVELDGNATRAAAGSMRRSKACAPRGETDDLPRGLLARAAFRRAVGDWDGAKRDLNEAKEIAEPGLMRLYWCDCALEGARLALARREAFAPLNGLVEPSPPPPVLPDATRRPRSERKRGRSSTSRASSSPNAATIAATRSLAELDAVVAGGRRFADLPPRV